MPENNERTASFAKKDYSNVNFEAVGDVITEWRASLGEFQSTIKKASEDVVLKTLSEMELVGTFPADFDSEILNIGQGIEQIILAIEKYIQDLISKDQSLAGLMPKRQNQQPAGSGSTQSTPVHEEPGTEPAEEPITDPAEEPVEEGMPAKPFDVSKITPGVEEHLSSIIFGLALDDKVVLDEFIKSEEGRQKILDYFKSGQDSIFGKTNSEFYKELLESNPDALMEYIMNLVNKRAKSQENQGLSNEILSKMMEEFMLINDKPGVKPMDLRKDFYKSLNKVMSLFYYPMRARSVSINKKFDDSIMEIAPTGMPPGLRKNLMLQAYDGNTEQKDITSTDLKLFRKALDTIAESNEINVEQLLMDHDNKYKNLFESMNGLNNARDNLSILNSCSDKYFSENMPQYFKENSTDSGRRVYM